MNKTLLFKEIESLPADLQQQVMDFVAFLKLKYRRGRVAEEFEFTAQELEELDRRWVEHEAAPESAMEVSELRTWIKAEYGVQSSDQ